MKIASSNLFQMCVLSISLSATWNLRLDKCLYDHFRNKILLNFHDNCFGQLNCFTFSHITCIRTTVEDLIHHNVETLPFQAWILLFEVSTSAGSKIEVRRTGNGNQFYDFGTNTRRLGVLRTVRGVEISPNDSMTRSLHPGNSSTESNRCRNSHCS